MKIPDQIKSLTKGQMHDLAMKHLAVEIEFEIRFGSNAFDTNFQYVKIEAMHESLHQLILDEEFTLDGAIH